jgi:hypothetical protein
MLASGAYVTLEHEYILIFRKGPKREFKSSIEKSERMKSAFFWEERNKWFSDVWDFKGTQQGLNHNELRSRSAAFPFELAYRLINMYSLYNDVVLDPFMGTGTTALAAIASGRNSIGAEIDAAFSDFILEQEKSFMPFANSVVSNRIKFHNEFVKAHSEEKGTLKYRNGNHGFPVITRQEQGIKLYKIAEINSKHCSDVEVQYVPVGKLENQADIQKEQYRIRMETAQQVALQF